MNVKKLQTIAITLLLVLSAHAYGEEVVMECNSAKDIQYRYNKGAPVNIRAASEAAARIKFAKYMDRYGGPSDGKTYVCKGCDVPLEGCERSAVYKGLGWENRNRQGFYFFMPNADGTWQVKVSCSECEGEECAQDAEAD